MSAACLVVFDVGGSTIRGTALDPKSGAVKGERRLDLRGDLGNTAAWGEEFREVVIATVRELVVDACPRAVVLGFPGPIDAAGRVMAAPTLIGACAEAADRVIEELRRFLAPAELLVLNDVTLAGYGLVANGERDFMILNVGSGVGHKIFLAGRPIVGRNGRGGEIGHLRVDWAPNATPCGCGSPGHVGAIASGRATIERYRVVDPAATQSGLSGRDGGLVARFHAADHRALAVVDESAKTIAHVLAAAHLLIGLERFVLAGGFAEALGASFRDLVVEWAERSTWDTGQKWHEMIALSPGTDGLVRAGSLWLWQMRAAESLGA